jgi:hypothetical protein
MVPGMLAPSPAGISSMAAAAAAALPGISAAVAPGGLPLAGMPGAVPGMDLALEQGLLGPPSPIPTQCLLLKNMFDAAQQAEAGWAEEIEDDVREECGKLGQVLHVFVDRSSKVRKQSGFEFVKLQSSKDHPCYYPYPLPMVSVVVVAVHRLHFGAVIALLNAARRLMSK